jgi:heme/copper-type cytochrome/quinol oxidase subunit 2
MPSLFANGLFWMSVACCAVAQFFIIRSVRGTRYVPEPTATVPRSSHAVEMLWAVLPAVGLIVLLAFTWRAIQPTSIARTHGMATVSAGPAT